MKSYKHLYLQERFDLILERHEKKRITRNRYKHDIKRLFQYYPRHSNNRRKLFDKITDFYTRPDLIIVD